MESNPETQVWYLIWEDPTYGATMPLSHNYWAHALEPRSRNYWAHKPQLLVTTETHML